MVWSILAHLTKRVTLAINWFTSYSSIVHRSFFLHKNILCNHWFFLANLGYDSFVWSSFTFVSDSTPPYNMALITKQIFFKFPLLITNTEFVARVTWRYHTCYRKWLPFRSTIVLSRLLLGFLLLTQFFV